MTYNSSFDTEMRRYQQEQFNAHMATSLTPRQLHTPIAQTDNHKLRRRRSSDSRPAKKPIFFLRRWFILLTIATFGAFYAAQAGYVRTIKNIGENVKATTGIDILSVDTYKELAKPPSEANLPAIAIPSSAPVKDFTAEAEATTKNNAQTPIMARDYSVNNEALGGDLSKIQEEAERLDSMAREFDQQFRK